MSVKIVTDSTSDLPLEVAKELNITVVPLNVHIGLRTYQEGSDISAVEFYDKLREKKALPTTSAPSADIFKECYQKLASSSGIISIHLSSKLSTTYSEALKGSQEANAGRCIEVIDSYNVSMGLGLLAVTAAKASRAGATIDEIVTLVKRSIGRIWAAGTLGRLELLQRGGRIGKARVSLGSMLNIKPLFGFKYGEVVPLERVRTHHHAVERLYELMKAHLPAREASVVYNSEAGEAENLASRARELFPEQRIIISRFSPVLGTKVDPDALAVFTLK